MDIELIKKEILDHGNRKVMTGFRCYPEHKQKLTNGADALGITLSEHIENQLLSVEQLKSEIKSLSELNDALKEKNARLENEKKAIIAENNTLKQKINQDQRLLSIYDEPNLLKLFSQFKGKEDYIITPEGEMQAFIYAEPKDLLKALIRSFKGKKH